MLRARSWSKQSALAVVAVTACTLSSSLDDLSGGTGGSGGAAGFVDDLCAAPVEVSCQDPGVGGASCDACLSAACCAELSACANDLDCRRMQGCVEARCGFDDAKSCGGVQCAPCLVGSGAWLWLALADCANDCANDCGGGTGGAAGSGSGGTGNVGGGVGGGTGGVTANDAGDADAPSGYCKPELGPDASCTAMSLGFGVECDKCAHDQCCVQVANCAANADCWGGLACFAEHCPAGDATCYLGYCSGCMGGMDLLYQVNECMTLFCTAACS